MTKAQRDAGKGFVSERQLRPAIAGRKFHGDASFRHFRKGVFPIPRVDEALGNANLDEAAVRINDFGAAVSFHPEAELPASAQVDMQTCRRPTWRTPPARQLDWISPGAEDAIRRRSV